MKRPNIVYILADDMGYGDISALNERCAWQTPALDRLRRQGMAFSDAHAVSALCTPSRYSLLTGRYCWRSLLKRDIIFGYDPPLIEENRMTVATFLQAQGYRTACVGKWHLGLGWRLTDPREPASVDFDAPIFPSVTDYGFDSFFGIPSSLDLPPYVYIRNDSVTAPPDRMASNWWDKGNSYNKEMFRAGPCGADFHHEEVLDTLTECALKTLEELATEEAPFFLYIPLTAPHTPILPSARFRKRSGVSSYGDFVLMCDDVVNRIDQKLRECGAAQDTILVFTSDNGCSPRADYPELAQYGHNPSHIFRGAKFDIFEGGHRVPFLLRWPGKVVPGSDCAELCCLMDLFATLADILDVPVPAGVAEDSVSNLPLWLGEGGQVRDTLMTHSMNGSFSFRSGKWKLILCPDSGGKSPPQPGDTPSHFPLLQLYDMDCDVRERENLAQHCPELVECLRSQAAELVCRYPNTGEQTWPELGWMKERAGE